MRHIEHGAREDGFGQVREPARLQVNDVVRELQSSTPFIAPEELEAARGQAFQARLGANENGLGCSRSAIVAAQQAALRMNHYADPRVVALRGALSGRLGIAEDCLLVGSGIDDLLGLTVRGCLARGDVVVASRGSYPTYQYFARGVGARVHGVEYRAWRNDLDALLDAAWQTKAKMVYLANPDNPTGTHDGAGAIEKFAERLPPTTWLLLDEAYADFCPPDTLIPNHVQRPNLVRFRTFSKAHGLAGCRVGYLMAASAFIGEMNKIRVQFGVNSVAQAAATAALADTEFSASVIADTQLGREEYYALGAELGIDTITSFTNFVAFDLQTAQKAQLVVDELDRRGVFVRRPQVAPLDRLVRVTVGHAPARKYFAEALRSIAERQLI